jgi:uncharacterized Zn finger protein
MEPRAQEKIAIQIHLDCEVCAETSVVEVAPRRAPCGIVACPRCGSTYLVSLDAKASSSRRSV